MEMMVVVEPQDIFVVLVVEPEVQQLFLVQLIVVQLVLVHLSQILAFLFSCPLRILIVRV
jgi:hypothetical protein